MAIFEQGLYPITDQSGESHLDQARRFIRLGIEVFQLRDKTLSDDALLVLLRRIARLCRPTGATVVVNDRATLALAAGTEAVHLGQKDLPPRKARALMGPAALIGLSTHTLPQVAAARSEPIDYIAFGPIFPTVTKADTAAPTGLQALRQACATSRLPVVAIGGITLENAPRVRDAGAAAVAVISDISASRDPDQRIRDYLQRSKEQV